MISFILPYPPTANTYWRHPTKGKLAGRHLISEKGRAYRAEVQALALTQKLNIGMNGRLKVNIQVLKPDNRKRDLDNLLKSLLDSIVKAGIVEDDSLFKDIRIIETGIEKPGSVFITIENL